LFARQLKDAQEVNVISFPGWHLMKIYAFGSKALQQKDVLGFSRNLDHYSV
jgi:hypothetical protein